MTPARQLHAVACICCSGENAWNFFYFPELTWREVTISKWTSRPLDRTVWEYNLARIIGSIAAKTTGACIYIYIYTPHDDGIALLARKCICLSVSNHGRAMNDTLETGFWVAGFSISRKGRCIQYDAIMRDICMEISGPWGLNTAGFVGENSTGVIFSHKFVRVLEGKSKNCYVESGG